MHRTEILKQASAAVSGDRDKTHGSPEESFALIAALWSADLGIKVSAADVARLMVLFKAARAKGNPQHADNWIDIAGYAACGGGIAANDGVTRFNQGPAPGYGPLDVQREPFSWLRNNATVGV